MKAAHAFVTLVLGALVGITWLRTFWCKPDAAPAIVIAMPIAAALLGLGHWISYDFSLSHWAGDFSLLQALFHVGVAVALLIRRSGPARFVS